MAEKKKPANKAAKAKPAAKKPEAKSIDWDSMPEEVQVILANGKESKAYRGTAKLLVESGKAKLK